MDYLSKMRRVIKDRNVNMHQLSVLFNKAPSTINNYLNGKNDMPLSFFIDFCNHFKIPYITLLSDHQDHQIIKFDLDNTKRENELMREIVSLKNRIIDLLEEKNPYTCAKSKAS